MWGGLATYGVAQTASGHSVGASTRIDSTPSTDLRQIASAQGLPSL
jgi:hypothetical protein